MIFLCCKGDPSLLGRPGVESCLLLSAGKECLSVPGKPALMFLLPGSHHLVGLTGVPGESGGVTSNKVISKLWAISLLVLNGLWLDPGLGFEQDSKVLLPDWLCQPATAGSICVPSGLLGYRLPESLTVSQSSCFHVSFLSPSWLVCYPVTSQFMLMNEVFL